jgi:hypothetical protein
VLTEEHKMKKDVMQKEGRMWEEEEEEFRKGRDRWRSLVVRQPIQEQKCRGKKMMKNHIHYIHYMIVFTSDISFSVVSNSDRLNII